MARAVQPRNRVFRGRGRRGGRLRSWLPWLLGAAALGLVIYIVLHLSEERAFVALLHHAEPWWLAVAAVLQLGTYFAEGEVWRVVIRTSGRDVPRLATWKLSVAKLFVDQAVPSAGISGTLVFARALESRGVERSVVRAAVVVDTVSYHVVYVASLAVALAILGIAGKATSLVVVTSAVFTALALTLVVVVLARSGRKPGYVLSRLSRLSAIRNALSVLADADPRLVRNHRSLFFASLDQLAIVFLDATTMWVLIRSLGDKPSAVGVFCSFMVSSLLRTAGVVPGGLGTFEAASVVTLRMAGVALPVALSATLLFRGMSFWMPLAPGLWFARHAVAERATADDDEPSSKEKPQRAPVRAPANPNARAQ